MVETLRQMRIRHFHLFDERRLFKSPACKDVAGSDPHRYVRPPNTNFVDTRDERREITATLRARGISTRTDGRK